MNTPGFTRSLTVGCIAVLTALVCAAANAKTLELKIEHTERLPALNGDLQPGKVFEEKNLDMLTGSTDWGESEWTRIPSWLAGTWQRQLVKEIIDGKKSDHADVRARILGYQTDAKGDIWHWNRYMVSQD